MKQQSLDLIQRWAQKPEKEFVRTLRRRRVSTGNQALARRIAAAPKPR
jgi:hypothetical protein